MSVINSKSDHPPHYSNPVNPSLYLDPDTAAFFKKETGIDDDAALKEHIIAVQADAYKACTCQFCIE